MTGIHNRTYGPILDMMSNAVMPMMNPSCSMALHAEIRDALMSPSCRKVIILAHGTGATILSHTMDKLQADLPMECMAKMEIYTFGAAARHMSNPCVMLEKGMRPDSNMGMNSNRTNDSSQMIRMEETERVIPVSLTVPFQYQC
jgi:hypothetical protein